MNSEIRFLTAEEIRAQQVGGHVLFPGVWADKSGGLHFSIPDMLSFVGLSDTPDNRIRAYEVCERIAAKHGIPVVRQELR